MANQPSCRFCSTPLKEVFADLGVSPLANSYLREDQLSKMEPHYPLKAWVCGSCMLVQLEEFESPAGIFSDYAYFSSFSTSWLAHAERYVQDMIARFGFDSKSQVIEIASNDGYLLQYFQAAGVPVLGIEPAANVAQAAIAKGIPSRTVFFGRDTARDLKADLLIGNNVYAHVPDLHSFTEGLKIALKPDGVITLEFPHLLRLMEEAQFDTIYHEHFSYLSLMTVQQIFTRHGLTVFDVEELPTHGGSLRVFGRHAENTKREITSRVESLLARERAAGLDRLDAYRNFTEKVKRVKCDVLCLPDSSAPRRKNRRRLRRACQGQHAPELLRNRSRASVLHGGSQPAQAGSIPAGYAHTHLSPRCNRTGATRLRTHSSLESEGRDHRTNEGDPELGWAFCGGNPVTRSTWHEVRADGDLRRVDGRTRTP